MVKREEYFINELKKDHVLYGIFFCIAEYSTVSEYIQNNKYIQQCSVKLRDVIYTIKSNVVNKSDNIIQMYIDNLIKDGLCEYCIENNESDSDATDLLKYYKDLGYPKEDTKIRLGSIGINVFRKINSDNESQKELKELSEKLQSIVDDITKPYDDKLKMYDDKFQKLTKEYDNTISKVDHMIDSGVIKNIQVLSIFAGIISLLFANIIGIKEFSSIGISGVLALNLSMLIAIIVLILASKLLIVGGEQDKKSIAICLIILLFMGILILILK